MILPEAIYIDTNLLVLLAIGRFNEKLIPKHKRSRQFSIEDYGRLCDLIGYIRNVFVTQNCLTEASNLIGQHGEPERQKVRAELTRIIEERREVVVESASAVRNPHYERMGLTDAALLEVISSKTPVVTVDIDLYLIATSNEPCSALNFNHDKMISSISSI